MFSRCIQAPRAPSAPTTSRRIAPAAPTRSAASSGAGEIAGLVTFLASSHSAALNGSSLHAGGGSPGVINY
jgi:hypothetical protein